MPKAASLRNLRPWKPGQSGNPNGRPRAPRFTERDQHAILTALAGAFGEGTQGTAIKAMQAVLTNPRAVLKALEPMSWTRSMGACCRASAPIGQRGASALVRGRAARRRRVVELRLSHRLRVISRRKVHLSCQPRDYRNRLDSRAHGTDRGAYLPRTILRLSSLSPQNMTLGTPPWRDQCLKDAGRARSSGSHS